jgi:hypothetical protein
VKKRSNGTSSVHASRVQAPRSRSAKSCGKPRENGRHLPQRSLSRKFRRCKECRGRGWRRGPTECVPCNGTGLVFRTADLGAALGLGSGYRARMLVRNEFPPAARLRMWRLIIEAVL